METNPESLVATSIIPWQGNSSLWYIVFLSYSSIKILTAFSSSSYSFPIAKLSASDNKGIYDMAVI